jgi:predicted ATPase/DNA-binding winged helix-turn-helix (wHTH) protein
MEDSSGRSVSFGPFRLYPEARLIEKEGLRLTLGSRALDVLIVLVDRAGDVVTHRELAQRVWRGLVVSPGSLRVHVSGLRKALGDNEAEPRYIANVPGQGYSFVAPVRQRRAEQAHEPAPTFEGQIRVESREIPPVEQPAGVRHNLPYPRTSFVAREREIRDLKGLLSSTRLLTLTGTGGCGKSRLALQVATEVLDDFPDGCWLVELAPLSDPTLVAQSVGKVLGIEEQGKGPMLDALARQLSTKRMLLVLDNTEHLIEPCAVLADHLLRCCSGLQVLATSREPLLASGELTYRVPSLAIPSVDDATVQGLLACESARLFVERARLHRQDFEVTPKNVPTLISICRCLDGIALAIELAAARTRTMSIEELNKHLDDRFSILTNGHRTALPRHRTLRSLIDWSHDLLTDGEKTVLRRIAVFPGGLTVDAAEFVCTGESVDRDRALDLLTSLTDKSLLIAEVLEESTRFRMLETLRQYAWERLRESGDEPRVRSLHLQFFADLAEDFGTEVNEDRHFEKLARIEQEIDNLRAALAWCDADVSRAPVGLQIVVRLALYWLTRGLSSEARGRIERLLEVIPSSVEDNEIRARALAIAGGMAYQQGDYSPAEAYFRESIPIYERLGLRHMVGRQLLNLGAVTAQRGEFLEAVEQYENALSYAREDGDPRHIAVCLGNLGNAACQINDFERARLALEECVSLSRAVGRWSTAKALLQLGCARSLQGAHQEARALLQEALDLGRDTEDKSELASILHSLGMVSHDLGDAPTAKAHLREALGIAYAIGDRFRVVQILEALAGLPPGFGAPTDAARLWGQAERLREDIGTPQGPHERKRIGRHIASAREELHDDAAFDGAWRQGRTMTLDEAVRLATRL